ncbi:MAG: DUF1345 domain-containing protein [Sphingomonadales bacterium]
MQKPKTLGQKIAPPRFLLFVAVLIVAVAAAWPSLGPARAFIAGFDIAAAVFLASVAPMLRPKGAADMRRHAALNDANRVGLLGLATLVTLIILVAIAVELNVKGGPSVPLVVATLALAWLFGNTVYALHYAHLYYVEGSTGGLGFSGTEKSPDYSDFIYFAFTLGMTFQTSDTSVDTRALRQVVTIHSLAAFVFNIGVLAFSINVLGSSH